MMFLMATAVLVISCDEQEVEEEIAVEQVEDGASQTADVVPGIAVFSAYYSHIKCEASDGGADEVLRAYFKNLEICECWTNQWIEDNCVGDIDDETTEAYSFCVPRSTNRVPFGALCPR